MNDSGQAVFTGVNSGLSGKSAHGCIFLGWDHFEECHSKYSWICVLHLDLAVNVNKNGQLAFLGSFDPTFTVLPFFYNGSSVQNLADSLPASSGANFFREIVINDIGQVAFSGCQAVGSVGACIQHSVFLLNGSGVSLLCSDCSFGDFIENLSINNRGHVAWSDHQSGGVNFFDGTSVRDLTTDPVAKGAGYFKFFNPKLNNADQIIFAKPNKFAIRS